MEKRGITFWQIVLAVVVGLEIFQSPNKYQSEFEAFPWWILTVAFIVGAVIWAFFQSGGIIARSKRKCLRHTAQKACPLGWRKTLLQMFAKAGYGPTKKSREAGGEGSSGLLNRASKGDSQRLRFSVASTKCGMNPPNALCPAFTIDKQILSGLNLYCWVLPPQPLFTMRWRRPS
jgi:hypothetical protein